jgi:RNA polymerase sigma-70 factor (ECF subfamily)
VGEHPTGGPAGAQHKHRSDAVDARATRDRELVDGAVALAKRGDHEGIRFIYSTYSGDVFRFVRSIVGDEHEAEDVTQTVFLKLMRVISKYERGTVPFTAWLMRVARNAAIDHLRERRPVPVEEIRGQSTPDAIDDNLERLMELRDAMAGLQDEQRRWFSCATSRGWRRGRSRPGSASPRAPSTASITGAGEPFRPVCASGAWPRLLASLGIRGQRFKVPSTDRGP